MANIGVPVVVGCMASQMMADPLWYTHLLILHAWCIDLPRFFRYGYLMVPQAIGDSEAVKMIFNAVE